MGRQTTDLELARRIVRAGLTLLGAGLNVGSSGNISARCSEGQALLITPSGRDWRLLRERELVIVDLETGSAVGGRPSSEWRLHVEIYRGRPDVAAVVHHHGPWASMVAVARQTIPVLIDEAAELGAVPTAPYAPSGSPELADVVSRELALGRNAILLANHGAVAVGRTLSEAVRRALEVERLAKIFVGAHVLGGAQPLAEADIAANRLFFERYRGAEPEARTWLGLIPPVRGSVRLSDLLDFGVQAGITMTRLLWALVHQRLRDRGAETRWL